MSGKYTFYVIANTNGSLVESVRNFSIVTNAPGLIFSSAITIYATAEASIIGHSIITFNQSFSDPASNAQLAFSRVYSLSGSWVASTTFIPYGVSNG